ncbi:MAG: DUF177 domain-containing protein [Actinobacteria bacterium]|nr:DUF177 domain-containing protein [Actinomycetota bacterium]
MADRQSTHVSVRALRLRPGEEHREAITLSLEPLRFGGEEYVVAPATIPTEVVVQRAASGDVFRLRFSAGLAGPCMRCLAPAELVLAVDAQEYEATDAAGDEELASEYVADGELAVGSWARDQLALAVPDQILCRLDCAGLCPVCGKDLNLVPHVHDEDATDSRWAALERLRSQGDA